MGEKKGRLDKMTFMRIFPTCKEQIHLGSVYASTETADEERKIIVEKSYNCKGNW